MFYHLGGGYRKFSLPWLNAELEADPVSVKDALPKRRSLNLLLSFHFLTVANKQKAMNNNKTFLTFKNQEYS